ncbi:prolyl oligopeptidase family serine peptidase [Ideonella sp. 4Y16]|uniref:Prolyl oligopeptidase family serine peptidase n=1 Tax=Ideonella alba TaxID=2824118 RepID=A0A940YBM8_9BURK|nr:PHB depolymerase family esterase [Ideonella alba]MBQ0932196.1 prolyl oligopeptidase family serine peptidase [Ideonella alba]MBQ0943701.1 prolyl oligopeptidase family serine peptidase [Ideonella alba]
MTLRLRLLLLLCALLGLPAHAADLAAGTHHWRLDWAGQSRELVVHVPPGLPAGLPVPLVLALHGGGGHAAFMADDERYGLSRQADRSGFVVAYPNGFSRLPGGRFATWNAGGCCGAARDRGSDDVGFIRAVVASVRERITIDPTRIFATGMSNGGMLAHRLACDAADLFRAVAAVAGTDATRQCTPSRPVSVLHIHARDDTHVLFNGGAGAEAFRDRAQVMDFVSVPDTIARWVQRDRCSGAPQRILERPGAYCEEHRDCAGGSRVRLCVTDTGGHSWPGAEQVRRGKPAASTALDANEAIWRFFDDVSSARR